ncbi:hypothetical protein Gpo141_00007980 [Globisporangium polare]
MHSLPLPIFRQIVAFALFDFSEALMPQPMVRIPYGGLRNLALVAKDWTAPVREILAHEKLSVLTIALDKATRAELAQYKRRVVLRGRYVRDLTISMGRWGPDKEFFMRNPGLHFVDDIQIPWNELFMRMPDLQRLDVSKIALSSPHLVQIVEAASTHCLGLRALLLPGKERHDAQVDPDVSVLIAKVYEALARWHVKGGHGGLRQLNLPARLDEDSLQSCTEYIENVIKHCPNIEYLGGHKHSLREMDRLTCQDQWIITKSTWEAFNKTCTHLREFNWIVAPFKDDFFQVFGAHRKPQLTHLTFGVNMLWDWSEYFEEIGEVDAKARSPFGILAKDAKAALEACPALLNLEVCFYHPIDEDILDNPMVMYEEEDYEFLVSEFPHSERFNQDVFGDQFCIAAAENCPLLQRISMWEVAERYNGNLTPISTFTDRGLAALSKLEWLSFIELRTVNCSGNGLFVLLNNFPKTFGGQRDMQISLGGASSRSELKFYKAVTQLLTLIAKRRDVRFADRRVVLRLMNSTFAPVDPAWSKDYLSKLEKLIAEVKQKHPKLRLRCGIRGRKAGGFSDIIEFGLYTTSSKPSMWYGWEDEDGQRSSDDVFISRGGGGPADYRADYGDHDEEYSDSDLFDVENLPLDYELDEYNYGGGYGYDEYDDDEYDDDEYDDNEYDDNEYDDEI